MRAAWHSLAQLSASTGTRLSVHPHPNQWPIRAARSVLEHLTPQTLSSALTKAVLGLANSPSSISATFATKLSALWRSKLHSTPPLQSEPPASQRPYSQAVRRFTCSSLTGLVPDPPLQGLTTRSPGRG